MTDNPLVSIVINNYNYDRFLQQAIDSAINQTYTNTEIIVVDDGSTDNSREIIASYGDKIIPLLKENGGQTSAFNAGFAASRGSIVCFLDSDDLFLPEKVAEVVNAFGNQPDLGWCFNRLKFVDEKLQEINDKTSIPKNSLSPLTEYDLREQIKRGKLDKNFPYPSTTGISLKPALLKQIMPMPEQSQAGTLLNESYIIFSSIGLSKGVAIGKELGLYRIHGSNANAMKYNQKRTAKIYILQAYWLRKNFPSLSKLTDFLMSKGIGIYERNGGVEAEYQEVVKSYQSSLKLLDKPEFYVRVFYNYIKNSKL